MSWASRSGEDEKGEPVLCFSFSIVKTVDVGDVGDIGEGHVLSSSATEDAEDADSCPPSDPSQIDEAVDDAEETVSAYWASILVSTTSWRGRVSSACCWTAIVAAILRDNPVQCRCYHD